MFEEYENKKRKQVTLMRSLMDYTMGIVIIALGVLLFFHEEFRIRINERLSHGIVKVLGVIFVLYGAWRIYRGYKKNYF
jgi:threonine/homoserine/homoserine lactone efflux protein